MVEQIVGLSTHFFLDDGIEHDLVRHGHADGAAGAKTLLHVVCVRKDVCKHGKHGYVCARKTRRVQIEGLSVQRKS